MKKIAAAILIFDCILGLLLFGFHTNKHTAASSDSAVAVLKDTEANREEQQQKDEEEKKIALTFDDDVIIGLSQEISYKEAVSMI